MVSPSALNAAARRVRSLEPTLTSAVSLSDGSITTSAAGMVTVTMHSSVRPLCEVTVMVAAPMPLAVNLPCSSTETTWLSLLTQVKSVRA